MFTNLSLTVMVSAGLCLKNLPFLVPEAADATVEFQINAIVDLLEKMKQGHDI